MITKPEILNQAKSKGILPDVIEKDYVLGWLLSAIYSHKDLKDQWVFKGGTCIKKCYFNEYRFSEDLDFTVKTFDHINENFLNQTFKGITESINDNVGVEFPVVEFEVFENPRGKIAAQGKLGYKGPNARKSSIPRVKIDLSADEILLLNTDKRPVFHPYSDFDENIFFAQAYQYEEVFAEKLRALIQRTRPRDLYDVVNIYHREDIRPDSKIIYSMLKDKCDFKELQIPTLNELKNNHKVIEELKQSWSPMLKQQMPVLPSPEEYLSQLDSVFDWLHRN